MIQRPNRDALYDNIEKARISGVEFWGEYRPQYGFFARLNGTFLDAYNDSNAGKIDLAYVPALSIYAESGYRFSWGSEIRFAAEHRGDVTEFSGGGDAVTIPSHTIWDLFFRHELDMGLGVTLQVENLTDKNYYQETGFERPGRNFRIAVDYAL